MNIHPDKPELLKIFFEKEHLYYLNILFLTELAIISGNIYDEITTSSLSQ